MEAIDPRQINISSITIDPELQLRDGTIEEIAVGYAELIESGVRWPSITVFEHPETGQRWVGDGNHTLRAHQILGRETILADVRVGTRRDALLFACSANKHGVPYTNATKRRIAKLLLSDPDWSQLTLRKLALLAGVSHTYIKKLKEEMITGGAGGVPRDVNVYILEEQETLSGERQNLLATDVNPEEMNAERPCAEATREAATEVDTGASRVSLGGTKPSTPATEDEWTEEKGTVQGLQRRETSLAALEVHEVIQDLDSSLEELAVETFLSAWLVLSRHGLNLEFLDKSWLKLLRQARLDQELPEIAVVVAVLQVQLEAQSLSHEVKNVKYKSRLVAMATAEEELDVDFICLVKEELEEAS